MEAQLVLAGFSAIVIGAFSLGALTMQMRRNSRAIEAMHARFDAVVIALAKRNILDAGAVAHLARARPRGVKV